MHAANASHLAPGRPPGRVRDSRPGTAGRSPATFPAVSDGLLLLGPSTADAGIGEEARRLRWLLAQGIPVPDTWVVTRSPIDGGAPAAALSGLGGEGRYAIWPSPGAHAEGPGAEAPAAPVFVAHSGLATAVAEAGRNGSPVLVQEIREAVASGVAFSRNPMTGLDEVVVEAVGGPRDRPAAEAVSTARWVHRWGAFVTSPDHPLLAAAEVRSIVERTRRLARGYGGPIALEWQWDGSRVWWTRLHPLTDLDTVTVYSNRISKEMMPGIIKPLVWSVNVPMVNGAWIRLFGELIGTHDLRPADLARAFAYRSYFNMTAIGGVFRLLGMPSDTLELLLGLEGGEARPRLRPTAATMRRLPRLLLAAGRKLGFGAVVRRDLPQLRAEFDRFPVGNLSAMTDEQLAADVSALMEVGCRAAYFNIVTPLLANLYSGMLRRRLAGAGVDFATFDLTAGRTDLETYQPGRHLDRLAELVATLDQATRERAAAEGPAALPERLRREFDRFLAAFGHLSDSGNDFSSVPWREKPELLLAMALAGGGPAARPERTTWEQVRSRLGPLRRPGARFLYGRARRFVVYREAVSSAYTLGYGLFRPYFLEMGKRLAERGLLARPDDVMYLYLKELTGTLLAGAGAGPVSALAAERRAEIERLRDAVMPELIFGDDFVPAGAATGAVRRLAGTPTSRGHHTGPARVIRGVAEFDRVRPGDVVVIPYSDVSWTPLFARASAVVAESGGMLSHSSIAAREYGLPCVVSVDGAMQVPDGALLSVDGYTGEVLVEPGGESGGR